ncbi:hypothetical protein TIFTF001_030037 [Ficus carica]|uniref:Methyltransferase type 11 domain-containing protein n=1 Tax=Ficus carica TaxID=3494 RepID=A0AA88J298_FICCA|nr:hypothetical protein TIFTF001_030037 [Ficus carica]
MADLFIKQVKQYAENRPDCPKELFEFIASKTPFHNLVWDVGTGSGQAAQSFKYTSPIMSISEVEQKIAPKSSLDLVTATQALHWLNLPSFYQQVKWVLKKPHGVIAA